jgi:hypothetical protein
VKSGAVAGLLLFGSFGAQGEGHLVDIEMIEIGSSIVKNEEAPPMDDLLMNEDVLRMDENTNRCDARKRKRASRRTEVGYIFVCHLRPIPCAAPIYRFSKVCTGLAVSPTCSQKTLPPDLRNERGLFLRKSEIRMLMSIVHAVESGLPRVLSSIATSFEKVSRLWYLTDHASTSSISSSSSSSSCCPALPNALPIPA